MIIKLNITDDLIKLLPTLYIQEEGDNKIVIDREWLFGGTHILEDISLALGIHDHAIKGTEDDPKVEHSMRKTQRECLICITMLRATFII